MQDTTTEQNSDYDDLEHMPVAELVSHINAEDNKVAAAVAAAMPALINLIEKIVDRLERGGRLFYVGAGTSGRLGILDASECPPTFGVPPELVTGLIAGGDAAIRRAVEGAEDDVKQCFADLIQYNVNEADIVVGISASGSTPYVLGGLSLCRENGITTGCIVNNRGTAIAQMADYPVEVITGPEFVTGSTRMKAGTAQKMVLNTISTATMIRLKRVQGNKMVYVKPANAKLKDRMVRIVMELTGRNRVESEHLLQQHNYDLHKALQ